MIDIKIDNAPIDKKSRQELAGRRPSEELVERLDQLELVEESFARDEPALHLTIVGQAIKTRPLH